MKTLQFQVSDELSERLEKLAAQQGEDYASVNASELSGRDALFTDLLILGLDEIAAGEDEYPDDV
ncbi:MAG: hypothetical protein GY862_26665 [Gammaproteobacteria bacterium]|nr:hypothetical protein [Gammaproteobacteria bacterium]